MKKFFNYIIYTLGVFSSVTVMVLVMSCTADFEDFNRNPGEPTEKEMKEGYYLIKSHFPTLINYAYPVQENAYQMTQSFIGDVYGRYFSVSKSGWQSHFQTFNAPDNWLKIPMEDTYKYTGRSFFEVEKLAKDEESFQHLYHFAKILRVTAFQRLTDMHGPLPYTQLRPGDLAVEYDDQETLYKKMFEELDEAIAYLTEFYKENPGYAASSDLLDNIYGNDYKKWVVYANTLKLRMAMRVRFAAPELAKEKAESAVKHEFGVMNANADNAYNSFQPNGLFKIAVEWGDARACADIICYMNGYNDPRRAKYFTKTEASNWDEEESIFVGIRSGITVTSQEVAKKFSTSTSVASSKLLIMPASESYFLRAEGALIGWDMGGTAQEFYEKGIRVSFEQYGITDAEDIDNYLNDEDNTPEDYSLFGDDLLIDPSVDYDVENESEATIKWEESDEMETKLEKIITQKWIAMFPLGQEAWSEQRRTGYPKFFPVLINLSGDDSLTENLASRIPYPKVEKDKPNYENVLQLLEGKDDYATKLWWDKNPNKQENNFE